jgi:hypothetical protein
MNGEEKVGCCCAWAGKTGGAIWVCLDFLAPPFVSRQKVETNKLKRILQRRISLTPMLHQLQHDNVHDARAAAISLYYKIEKQA